MLVERKAQVTAELEEARRLHEEARALLSQYEGRLARLDAEKSQILSDYRQLGEAERDRIITEAKRQAEKIGKDAELTVQGEVRRARAALEREVVELASGMAEERLRQRLDAREQGALFDAYLTEIERDLRA
jgi:F-type H+-transporting ATPase subunit b